MSFRTLYFILLTCFLTNLSGQDDSAFNVMMRYELDFEQENILSYFDFSDPNAWRLSQTDKGTSLELFAESKYEPKARSPFNIAMINSISFGTFQIDVLVKQTGREYDHRDMCLFFGMKDPSNYYYVHLASKPDENAHNIFIVNDEPRRPIGTSVSKGVDWGDVWHTVRIIRNITDGTIKVFFDDMTTPIMEAVDHHFQYGYIGFGSFDDTGMIDKIIMRTDDLGETKPSFFSKKNY